MPPQLALHFLGPPQLFLNHEPITSSRRKATALLAYLAVNGNGQTRDFLSALLWPEYDQSRAFTNLRHTLWEVQQTIGEGWIIAERETIELNPKADLSVDVHRFESLLGQSRALQVAARRIPLLSDAVNLYRNHFLTGFSLKDAAGFNEWAFAKSEELRHQLAGALLLLSEDYCALDQLDRAIPHARRLVALDPLDEGSHRQLMRVYIQAGQHSAALKQYQACEQILRRQLGIDPEPETRDLYKKIRKREIQPVPVQKQTENGTHPHNIPLQLSSFIGREKEQKVISRLLASQRLVTLIGAGGIGKTRLSLKVGEQFLHEFSHGVWFVELASLNDPALVPQAVSAVFDIVERSQKNLTEKLIDHLRSKTALLILDNCEHLIDACVQLAESLLKNCPALKILATSREALGLVGEALYRVPSLSVPKSKQEFDQLEEYEAIRLFVERARLSTIDFGLTPENSGVVVDICQRLDAIPLAIELAAARVSTLSVEQIGVRLHESFNLLTGNGRTRLARQQTLQASIDWSWNLLSDAERILLRRLSIFAGGWTLEAAEAVCSGNGMESQHVLELMTQLVMKSLVVVDHEPIGERRYRLLEMIRQYAHEKRIQSEDEEQIRAFHLKYFIHLSTQAQLELRGPSQVDWMELLNDERHNLRAALRWAETTDVEAGLLLASRLLRYWESSDLREGTHRLNTLLQKEESNGFPQAKAYALHAYGSLLVWLQNFDEARLAVEECLTLSRAGGDRECEIDALLVLSNIFRFKYDAATAEKYGEQAIKISQALGDPWREASSLYALGWVTRDYGLMFNRWGKAISLFREVGDQVSLANVLGWLGQFRVLNGDFELAETYLDEAMQLWQSNKRANIWDNIKIAHSLIMLVRGEYEQATAMLQEIMVSAEETGNTMSKLWVTVRLGYVALRTGNIADADHLFRESAQGFARDGFTIGAVFALEGMAELHVAVGKPARAAQLIGWADTIRVSLNDPRPNIEQADVERMIAACLAKIGEEDFSDAYDEGIKMSLDEALAFAFEENQEKSGG
ncbi:MAG TPA: BTAD domain-containing putative transcriptional regulator [Anaerolineales bacterium]